MREAFEAKLSEAQEALRLEKLERRREVHRLVTTHAEELRAAEAGAAPAAIRRSRTVRLYVSEDRMK